MSKRPEDGADENPDTIYLRFCFGRRGSVPTGHIWEAVKLDEWTSGRNMGWFTEEEAIKKFGIERVVKTESSTQCPSCKQDFDKEVEEYHRKKRQ